MSGRYLKEKTISARKEHVCTLCGELILLGEKYIYRFGTDDGPVVMKW
jgi:hypothetical protein